MFFNENSDFSFESNEKVIYKIYHNHERPMAIRIDFYPEESSEIAFAQVRVLLCTSHRTR